MENKVIDKYFNGEILHYAIVPEMDFESEEDYLPWSKEWKSIRPVDFPLTDELHIYYYLTKNDCPLLPIEWLAAEPQYISCTFLALNWCFKNGHENFDIQEFVNLPIEEPKYERLYRGHKLKLAEISCISKEDVDNAILISKEPIIIG